MLVSSGNQWLKQTCPGRMTGAQLPGRQQFPGHIVVPERCESIELWCAIARPRTSRFRVRSCGPPRNDEENGLRRRRRRRVEYQTEAVDAVAQAGGLRTIVEDMAEMAAAAPAMHLGAD